MCIYVQSPLTESLTYFVHPLPPATSSESWGNMNNEKSAILHGVGTAFNQWPHNHKEAAKGYGELHGGAANQVRNYIYATNGPHPSDIVVAYDNDLQRYVLSLWQTSNPPFLTQYNQTSEGRKIDRVHFQGKSEPRRNATTSLYEPFAAGGLQTRTQESPKSH